MSSDVEPFGAQLYGELRKLSGYDVITGLLDYKAIQQLKQADRQTTLKLFSNSSYEVLQQIKAKDPKEVGRYLVERAKRAPNDELAILIVLLAR